MRWTPVPKGPSLFFYLFIHYSSVVGRAVLGLVRRICSDHVVVAAVLRQVVHKRSCVLTDELAVGVLAVDDERRCAEARLVLAYEVLVDLIGDLGVECGLDLLPGCAVIPHSPSHNNLRGILPKVVRSVEDVVADIGAAIGLECNRGSAPCVAEGVAELLAVYPALQMFLPDASVLYEGDVR